MSFVVPTQLQLPKISVLSSRVIRVMGLNPSPMTLGGTNTYIVGTGAGRALIDTGEGVSSYADLLKEALAVAATASGLPSVKVSTVLLTHWHHDHIGGLRDVLDLFPEAVVQKQPSRVTPAAMSVSTSFGLTPKEGKLAEAPIQVAVEGATLSALWTPGHTDDHVAFYLAEEQAVFTGDCILGGGGSSVFANYADFMQSLQLLRDDIKPTLLYPGHGPVEVDGVGRVAGYIAHRGKRDDQIVAALLSVGCATAPEIVELVYTDTPRSLFPAATINVLHHLKKMARHGLVEACGRASRALSERESAALAADDYEVCAGSSMLNAAQRAAARLASAASSTGCVDCMATEEAHNATQAALGGVGWRPTPKLRSLLYGISIRGCCLPIRALIALVRVEEAQDDVESSNRRRLLSRWLRSFAVDDNVRRRFSAKTSGTLSEGNGRNANDRACS